MRVHDLYREINVKQQERDKSSLLGFWKRMIKLRKRFGEVFIHGEFEGFDMENEKTFAFGKKSVEDGGRKRAVVVCNFSGEEQEVELPGGGYEGVKFMVGSYEDAEEKERTLNGGSSRKRMLRPWEGRLYAVGCDLEREV